MNNTNNAYVEGKTARRADLPITACPYPFRTPEYASWRGGWSDEVTDRSNEFLIGHKGDQSLDAGPPVRVPENATGAEVLKIFKEEFLRG